MAGRQWPVASGRWPEPIPGTPGRGDVEPAGLPAACVGPAGAGGPKARRFPSPGQRPRCHTHVTFVGPAAAVGPKARRSPSPGQRPGETSNAPNPCGPTGQGFALRRGAGNDWPVGPTNRRGRAPIPRAVPWAGRTVLRWSSSSGGRRKAGHGPLVTGHCSSLPSLLLWSAAENSMLPLLNEMVGDIAGPPGWLGSGAPMFWYGDAVLGDQFPHIVVGSAVGTKPGTPEIHWTPRLASGQNVAAPHDRTSRLAGSGESRGINIPRVERIMVVYRVPRLNPRVTIRYAAGLVVSGAPGGPA